MLRRLQVGLGVLGIVCGAGLAAGACSTDPGTIDPDYIATCEDWPIVTCSTTADCYAEERYVYELGTECINDHCLCPVDGWVMCNKKGHPPYNNMRQCWPYEECEPGEMCIPEEPAPPGPECTEEDLSKCPGPLDERCGVATCDDGVCGVEITPGPVASQKAGDCKRSICTLSGFVMEEEDLSDYYDDGEQCTFDMCIDGQAQAVTIASVVGPGSIIVCPDTAEGYCSDSKCVQCLEHGDCNPTDICNLGRCMPLTCANGMKDGAAESDIDCGVKCLPCASGKACVVNADCTSNVCKDMQCQAPTCEDKVKNDGEADTDCGAACKNPLKLCVEGQGCKTGADCESDVCWAGACRAATCTDGVQNAKETGIDCGGDCPAC